MAKRSSNQVVSYRSISKPRVSAGGFSSFGSTLAKKTQAAEDAIIDNQYQAGDISQDYYLSKISERLARPDISPLQQVNLRQKYQDVGVRAYETRLNADVASGSKTTKDLLDYQITKLNGMDASDSAAYQTQQKLVQDLTDKSQREDRAAARVAEMKRISTLPEDSDKSLQAKADLYDKLSHQARLDGDTQTADTLETSKNNYLSAAKRAGINDLITNTKQSVSETLPGGLGVPSSSGGGDYYAKLTGSNLPGYSTTQPGLTVNSGTPAGGVTQKQGAVAKTYSTVGHNGQIDSALKGLDSLQKSTDRIQAQIKDKTSMLSTYDNAISQADGDQKTSLTIARNNLVSELSTLNNSLDNNYTNIQDKVTAINDLQTKVAFGNFKKSVSTETNALNLQEKKLESDLRSGKIDKSKYLFESANLTGSRIALLNDTSSGYRQFGEDNTADTIDQQTTDIANSRAATIYQTLVDGTSKLKDPKQQDIFINNTIKQLGGNYEMVRVDKDGTLNNISNKALKRGDVSLIDVSQEKYDGTFARSYVKDGNVYAKINFPTQIDPVTGQQVQIKDPTKIKGNAPYYIGGDGQAKQIKFVNQAKQGQAPVYVPVSTADFNKQAGKYQPAIANSSLVYNLKPAATAPFKLPSFINPQNANKVAQFGGAITNPIGTAINFAGSKITDVVKNLFGGGNKAQPKGAQTSLPLDINGAIKRVAGSIVPVANAAELRRQGSNPAPVNGVPANTVALVTDALKKQGIYSPSTLAYALATIQHETGGSFQPVNEGYYLDKGQEPGTAGRQIAIQNGYDGGENYYGRGFIQLTGLPNYDHYGKALGIDLVNNPDLANDPKTAARIMAQYMKERGTAALANQGNFVAARGTINNDNKGNYIAGLAKGFLSNINSIVPKANATVVNSKPRVEQSTVQRIIQGNQPGIKTNSFATPTPTPSAAFRSTSTPSPTPSFSSGGGNPLPQNRSVQSPIPQNQIYKPPAQPNLFQNLGNFANNAVRSITSVFNPPKPAPAPKIAAPKPANNPVQNIVNSARNVASNVGKAIGNFFGRK